MVVGVAEQSRGVERLVELALAVADRVEQRAQHLVLSPQPGDRLRDGNRRIFKLGRVIGTQRGTQVLADTDVVDDQTPELALEDTIHPRNRL